MGDGVPATAEAHSDPQVEAARRGLQSVRQAKADLKRQRQDFARARADLLRRELEHLRLMGGATTKGTARRATCIAGELASVVRDWHSGEAVDAETISRSAAGRLAQAGGVGGDGAFAAQIRTLFLQARNVVEDQRRRAEEDGRGDAEYVLLCEQVQAMAVPLDLEV